MRIFKFGGASVKDANGVKNLVKVLQHEGVDNMFVIISAMGKMTNAFEKIVDAYCFKKEGLSNAISDVNTFHLDILNDLFSDKNHSVFLQTEHFFLQLKEFITENENQDYDFIYDQIASFGELLSTKITSAYLNEVGIATNWIDVREYIRTDNSYRDAKVDWEETKKLISSNIDTFKLNITQGFLGGNNGYTTTLGREGSDYTASIFAYCLNAESVTIWKDVEGVLNADPRTFKDTVLLERISYKEAIELAYYGASVIHPKTLKPLENKLIPLYVRSFDNLKNKGTSVKKGTDLEPKVPCFIQKKHQILVSISAVDFSFVVEHNMSDIFQHLHKFKLKVNLIQNSALSFSLCIEDNFNTFDAFYQDMKSKYKITYNENVTLFTIRHFDTASLERVEKNNIVLLKQTSRETVQIVIE